MTDQQAIDYYVDRLRAAGARGVDGYEKTIRNNSRNEKQVLNFLSEAIAALMFLEHGAEVTMRDKPDLDVTLRGESFYAEVKHFNRKEQDDLDDEALRNAPEYEFVPVGDTVPTEGKSSYRQIANVAIRKADQYIEGAVNILVIHSDSEALHLMCSSGANEFSDEMKATPHDSPLRRLHGIMLINCLIGCRGGPWNVEFAITKVSSSKDELSATQRTGGNPDRVSQGKVITAEARCLVHVFCTPGKSRTKRRLGFFIPRTPAS